MDKLKKKFENLSPTDKVKLLEASSDTSRLYEVLALFHNQRLCIECGKQTQIGDRQMTAFDGEWPTRYLNLWKCRGCLEFIQDNMSEVCDKNPQPEPQSSGLDD